MADQRCPTCPGPAVCQTVRGAGPVPCRLLFIGAGPGQTEARTGIPYSGLAGDELTDTYLPIAGLSRADIHITNATLCYDGGGDRVPDKRVSECARWHLSAVLDRVRPEVVVLMGGQPQRLATRADGSRIRLDMMHGVPQCEASVLGYVCTVWPSYEPALGMRDTGRMTQLIDDFRHLGQWLRGEWEPLSERTMPAPMKYELLHGELNGMHPRIAIDTEKHGNAPWSVQWSGRPGTGYMLLAEDGRGIGKFAAWIREYPETGVILHNAPGDLDTLDALGIHIGTGQFRDTMQEAYQLCSLPQGLKALAYRTLGVEMRSWEDVVWPASIDKLVRWMADALQLVGVDQRFSTTVTTPLTMGKCPACGTRGKGTNCKVCGEFISKVKVEHVPTAAAGILAHVLRHTVETAADEADEPYNPWRAMERMRVEGLRGKRAEGWEWDVLAETLGEPPILGIGNCELADAVEYGCGDADMTGQVAAVMERERQSDRWKIDDADKDR